MDDVIEAVVVEDEIMAEVVANGKRTMRLATGRDRQAYIDQARIAADDLWLAVAMHPELAPPIDADTVALAQAHSLSWGPTFRQVCLHRWAVPDRRGWVPSVPRISNS